MAGKLEISESDGFTVSVVSSRLTRDLAEWNDWFRHLRAICSYVNARRGRLRLVPKTTAYPYLQRACDLFECRSVSSTSVSPRFRNLVRGKVPERDVRAVTQADEVMVMHVRPQGTIHRLLLEVLKWPPHQRPRINLAMFTQTPRTVRDELIGAGAIAWLPGLPAPADPPGNAAMPAVTNTNDDGFELNDALIHCTRAQRGPWPGETKTQYLDDLLLGLPRARHSPLAALIRIAASRRLMASSLGIRGGYAVVSFTEANFAALQSMRTYRSHRGRWDFEPFGIGIRRSWLVARGARPVRYGNDDDWEKLATDERPFFQKALSTAGTRTLDWTTEREWRHLGDIDLAQLPARDAFLFVRDPADAAKIARICEWPVRTVPGTTALPSR